SKPDQLVVYTDGRKAFFWVITFEVEVLDWTLGLSTETTSFGYFTLEEMNTMPMHGEHKLRVEDALRGGDAVMR
ncbi:MAG: hypothetical protein ACKOGC_02950, partial [Anaerolineae bacterium]